ncbi:MAG: polymer-forming cytoskeletal protein [Treponema sp.]
MALRADNFSINTLIGNGSFVRGDLNVNGSVSIDGDLDGNLKTDASVIVSVNARIKGNIDAASAVIGGIVLGDITAPKSVKLLSSSAVIGNIITQRVQMEDKVIFHGHCISISDKEKCTEHANKFLEDKAILDKAEGV